jgi:hypothetical protein
MKCIQLFFSLIVIALISASAYAASGKYSSGHEPSTNMYLGLSMGDVKTDFPNVNNSAPSLTSPYSYSLLMGAIFNEYMAGELAYSTLGITDLGNSVNLKGSAYNLCAVGKIPVSDSVNVIGKLGIANTGVYFETGGNPGGTETLVAPTYGVGLQINFDRAIGFGLRIAYDNFKFTTNNSSTYNANIISLSALYRF